MVSDLKFAEKLFEKPVILISYNVSTPTHLVENNYGFYVCTFSSLEDNDVWSQGVCVCVCVCMCICGLVVF